MDSSVFDSRNKLEISLYTDNTHVKGKKFTRKLIESHVFRQLEFPKASFECLFSLKFPLISSCLTSTQSYEIWMIWQVDKSSCSFINHQLSHSHLHLKSCLRCFRKLFILESEIFSLIFDFPSSSDFSQFRSQKF